KREIGAFQSRPAEARARKLGFAKGGLAQVGAVRRAQERGVAALEDRARRLHRREPRVGQRAVGEARRLELRAAEVRLVERALVEARLREIRGAQVGAARAAALEVSVPQVRVAEGRVV